ncbi:MAG: sigma-70 family RNA polymerase sigma factor [Isosphaeraceae bacterium]
MTPGDVPMGTHESDETGALEPLLRRAAAGDEQAAGILFARYRERLKQMVRLRLDRRLQGRIDPSDVLQDAYLEVASRIRAYAQSPPLPVFLWLRSLVGQKLVDLARHHLGTKMRNVGQEVSLYRGAMPQASSASLAAHLLGRMTSPSMAAARAEMQVRIQEALNGMEPIDREILTLRHFEMLTNSETAQVLGLSKAAASNRYIRALKRLKETLESTPGHGAFPGRP